MIIVNPWFVEIRFRLIFYLDTSGEVTEVAYQFLAVLPTTYRITASAKARQACDNLRTLGTDARGGVRPTRRARVRDGLRGALSLQFVRLGARVTRFVVFAYIARFG